MTLKEAIRERHSVRSFLPEELDMETLDALRTVLHEAPGPWGAGRRELSRLELLVKEPGSKVKLGTYGVISGARTYMGLFVKDPNDARALIEAAYAMEHAVLTAVTLGLGTVWLGGTLNRSQFLDAFGKQGDVDDLEGWNLVCVVPVGIPAGKRGIIDSVLRKVASSDKRRPFNQSFYLQDFQTPYPTTGPLAEAFEAVCLAPSAANRQPWRILAVDPGWIHVYAGDDPGFVNIDTGIAMAHFDISRGRTTALWQVEPDWPYTPPKGLTYMVSTAY